MKNFDPNKLRDYLNARKGCTFATMWAITAPKMNKTENPYFDRVVHRWSKNVTFGANYSRSVNRKWEKTDTDELFIAEALWRGHGERINEYMARHKTEGTEYLVYLLRTNADGLVMPAPVDEYLDAFTGEPIEKEKLLPFMPKKSPNKKQRVEELGIAETFPRTVKIDGGSLGKFRLGLHSIVIDREQYLIEV
jgi:hypothetical protein